MRDLTKRQRAFANEYLICLNATEAAIKAGYSHKSARYTGRDLLKDPRISEYIADTLKSIESRQVATAQEALEYLTAVMRGETEAEIIVIEKIGNGCSRARHIMKTPSTNERLRAAELLGKRLGLFSGKIDVISPAPVIIIDSVPPDNDDVQGVRIDRLFTDNAKEDQV